jgi:formylglycine-generating enzyme required for sulfatase activity
MDMIEDSEGLHEIANTQNASREADIVFIHGLGGGPHGTWQFKTNARDFFWPTEMAKALPHCGVWSLGHASGMSHWFSQEGMALEDRANNLALKLINADLGRQPLIFIAHSMGGLVVKEFVTAAIGLGGSDWSAIANSVRGIVFLGTPHHGSHMAKVAKGFAVLLRTQQHLKQMTFAAPALDQLHKRFMKWQNQTKCFVESYVETRGIARMGWVSRLAPRVLVVPRISGDPNLVDCSCHLIAADHISLVKPDSGKHDVFRGVLRFVNATLASAASKTPTASSELSTHPGGEQKQARAVPEIFVRVDDSGGKGVTVLHGRWPTAGCVFRDNAADGTPNSAFPEMVIIGPGEYLMGSDFVEPSLLELSKCSLINEAPIHKVNIEYIFAMARYPVTFEEFDSIAHRTWGLGTLNDNSWGRGRRPAINANWNQAKYFVERLSLRTGKIYRLPSESEWEYACRSGSGKNGHEDQPSDKEAHFDAMALYRWAHEDDDSLSAPKATIEVGSFPPNAFGLYDMRGNVWEWCEDTYVENYFGAPVDGSPRLQPESETRVIRGGSWRDSKSYLRAACRQPLDQNEHASDLGFRVVRMIEF